MAACDPWLMEAEMSEAGDGGYNEPQGGGDDGEDDGVGGRGEREGRWDEGWDEAMAEAREGNRGGYPRRETPT